MHRCTGFRTYVNQSEPALPSQVNGMNCNHGLREIAEIPLQYQHIFSEFQFFNYIQSQLLDDLLHDDSPIVVSAPTGSGKTALFELAIIRLLEKCQNEDSQIINQKIVYMAPVKALCSERYNDWESKFQRLGLKAIEVTGDSDEGNLLAIQHFNLVLTTPEKWDSLTRKWKDHSSLVSFIKLFLIDEVHLLNEDKRGSTLEAVVSRMKTVQEYSSCSGYIRFIALSATIPNIEDVAAWLGKKSIPAKFYKFGEETRPVRLRKIVKAFPFSGSMSYFKFDLNLSYKLKQLILDYSEGKPTLVFCSTRKSVLQTSSTLLQTITFHFTPVQRMTLEEARASIQDSKLRDMVQYGVGFHHAGLLASDRYVIEQVFRSGFLPVLICTSTLAMGVNLPAHLVVIKSTAQYINGSWEEYSEGQVLQMMGRAGRPQFDTSATAVILTKSSLKEKYEKLILGNEIVESSLHKNLAEHLNSEIVLGTITDVAVAVHWIRSTFLYVRSLKNPKYYGIPSGLSTPELEARLQALCLRELNGLEKYDLIKKTDFAYNVEPTENGKLMARLFIAFETMKIFMKVKGTENMPDILQIICMSHEFNDIQLRVNERTPLNILNCSKDKETIRYPLQGRIKTREMKVNCLIQATLGYLHIPDPSLSQEAIKIVRISERIAKALSLYLWQKDFFQALASSLILAKCLTARMWENSIYLSRHLPGIGPALAALLAAAKKTTFKSIANSNPRDLERILNKHPPVGNSLQEAARSFPNYDLKLTFGEISRKVYITLKLLNAESVHDVNRTSNFLVGDSNNKILHKERIRDGYLIENEGKYDVTIHITPGVSSIVACLISDTLVGVDIKKSISLAKNNGETSMNSSYCEYSYAEDEDSQSSATEKVVNYKEKIGDKRKGQKGQPSTAKKKTKIETKNKYQTSLHQFAFAPVQGKKFQHNETPKMDGSDRVVSSTQDGLKHSNSSSADNTKVSMSENTLQYSRRLCFEGRSTDNINDINYDNGKRNEKAKHFHDESIRNDSIESENIYQMENSNTHSLEPIGSMYYSHIKVDNSSHLCQMQSKSSGSIKTLYENKCITKDECGTAQNKKFHIKTQKKYTSKEQDVNSNEDIDNNIISSNRTNDICGKSKNLLINGENSLIVLKSSQNLSLKDKIFCSQNDVSLRKENPLINQHKFNKEEDGTDCLLESGKSTIQYIEEKKVLDKKRKQEAFKTSPTDFLNKDQQKSTSNKKFDKLKPIFKIDAIAEGDIIIRKELKTIEISNDSLSAQELPSSSKNDEPNTTISSEQCDNRTNEKPVEITDAAEKHFYYKKYSSAEVKHKEIKEDIPDQEIPDKEVQQLFHSNESRNFLKEETKMSTEFIQKIDGNEDDENLGNYVCPKETSRPSSEHHHLKNKNSLVSQGTTDNNFEHMRNVVNKLIEKNSLDQESEDSRNEEIYSDNNQKKMSLQTKGDVLPSAEIQKRDESDHGTSIQENINITENRTNVENNSQNTSCDSWLEDIDEGGSNFLDLDAIESPKELTASFCKQPLHKEPEANKSISELDDLFFESPDENDGRNTKNKKSRLTSSDKNKRHEINEQTGLVSSSSDCLKRNIETTKNRDYNYREQFELRREMKDNNDVENYIFKSDGPCNFSNYNQTSWKVSPSRLPFDESHLGQKLLRAEYGDPFAPIHNSGTVKKIEDNLEKTSVLNPGLKTCDEGQNNVSLPPEKLRGFYTQEYPLNSQNRHEMGYSHVYQQHKIVDSSDCNYTDERECFQQEFFPRHSNTNVKINPCNSIYSQSKHEDSRNASMKKYYPVLKNVFGITGNHCNTKKLNLSNVNKKHSMYNASNSFYEMQGNVQELPVKEKYFISPFHVSNNSFPENIETYKRYLSEHNPFAGQSKMAKQLRIEKNDHHDLSFSGLANLMYQSTDSPTCSAFMPLSQSSTSMVTALRPQPQLILSNQSQPNITSINIQPFPSGDLSHSNFKHMFLTVDNHEPIAGHTFQNIGHHQIQDLYQEQSKIIHQQKGHTIVRPIPISSYNPHSKAIYQSEPYLPSQVFKPVPIYNQNSFNEEEIDSDDEVPDENLFRYPGSAHNSCGMSPSPPLSGEYFERAISQGEPVGMNSSFLASSTD